MQYNAQGAYLTEVSDDEYLKDEIFRHFSKFH